jgi:hypothetical protein
MWGLNPYHWQKMLTKQRLHNWWCVVINGFNFRVLCFKEAKTNRRRKAGIADMVTLGLQRLADRH